MDTINGAICLFSAILVGLLLLTEVTVSGGYKVYSTRTGHGLLLSSLVLLLSNGFTRTVFRSSPTICSLLRLLSGVVFYLVLALYTGYLEQALGSEGRKTRRLVLVSWISCGLGALCWVLNRHACTEEVSGPRVLILVMMTLAGLLTTVADVLLVLHYRRRLDRADVVFLLAVPLLPAVTNIAHFLVSGLSMVYPLVVILVYLNYFRITRRRGLQLARKEREAKEYQLRMTLERVKPHFIYNVLTGIYYLCDEDPQKAKAAIASLTDYLRSMLPAVGENHMVPFSQELGLIRAYMDLERMRCGDGLRLRTELGEEDFCLPPFTVQPLVENAVKHGFDRKKGSCEILLQTERSGEDILITVRDNGRGFSPDRELPQRPSGTNNIREMLQLTHCGDLSLESTPGVGTTARLRIYGQCRKNFK